MTIESYTPRKMEMGGGGGPSSPGYSSSPLRSSPLSNPPIISTYHTNTPRRTSMSHSSRPTPIPTKSTRRSSVKSPPCSFSSHTLQPSPQEIADIIPIQPSPPLSRSHPLLGSFSLSLLHSRMSLAHQPHQVNPSSTTGFSLHIGSIGKGRSCPRELRCPGHEIVPFIATYYDLEDGGRKSQSPWVGTVDLEDHYYTKYSSDIAQPKVDLGKRKEKPVPPLYPGYRVAPVGQLQLLIKTPDSAVKVFLLPYDLRDVPSGGRLLARERIFVQPRRVDPNLGSTPTSARINTASREKLRYSVQLQFVCIPRPDSIVPPRESSTTRRTRAQKAQSQLSASVTESSSPVNDYYLARAIKVIFTSTPAEKDEMERSERTDEIIGATDPTGYRGRTPTSSPIQSINTLSRSTPTRDDWDTVCKKWHARRAVEMATFEMEPVQSDLPRSVTPISLLSSQVLSPPTHSTALPSDSISPLFTPLPILHAPVPTFTEKNGLRSSSPQPPSVRTPPIVRYPSRQKLRRGSGSLDERELSEKLRNIRLSNESS